MSGSVIVIGRWSELSVLCVCQDVEMAMSGEVIVMSGDEGCWLGEMRVGVGVLMVQ